VLIINTIVCKMAEIIAQMLLTSCSIVAHFSFPEIAGLLRENCGNPSGLLRETAEAINYYQAKKTLRFTVGDFSSASVYYAQ
jgi:hypothetical protein